MIDQTVATDEVRALLDRHGLHTWQLAWTNSTRTFGECDHDTSTIKISWPITRLNALEELSRTVRHEIAHAKAGPAAGHGPAWRLQCRQLGIAPVRCLGPEVATPPGRWTGTCPACGWTTSRIQLRTSTRAASCPRCDDAYNPALRLTWTRNPEFTPPRETP